MSKIIKEIPLSIHDACILVESLDNPFRVGGRNPVKLFDSEIEHGLSEYNHYDLEHGKEGQLVVFKRDGAYEIHHENFDEHGNPISGRIYSSRAGANPRYIATMAHVAKTLIGQGKNVRISGTVSTGMFDKYRRLGVILAKRHDMLVTPVKNYTYKLNPNHEDMKEFTIHSKSDSNKLQHIAERVLAHASFDNDYVIWESSYDGPDELSMTVNKGGHL